MANAIEPSRARKLAASASLMVPAVAVGVETSRHAHVELGAIAYIVCVAAAAFAITRKSVTSQIVARGVAWSALVPGVIATAASLVRGHAPPGIAVAFALGGGAALLLARPMLHTESARAAFAPVRFRHWFLAGATACVTAAVGASMAALDLARWHEWGPALASGAVALTMAAMAAGVARMRAWGILLGGLVSTVCLVATVALHSEASILTLAAALPGLWLLAPLVFARLFPQSAPAMMRVAPVHVRVASVDEVEADSESDAPPRRAAARMLDA